MSFIVHFSKSFNGNLRDLQRQGHKKIVQAIRAAVSEAGMDGEITAIPRTKHGETRLPNVEKFDLTDGFRLVVQLVDGRSKTRAFLFAGTHEDAERWLDSHKNYRWVKGGTASSLQFVQVTESVEQRHVPSDRLDLETPDRLLELPLLRTIQDTQWDRLEVSDEVRTYCKSITGNDYVESADSILEQLDQLIDWDKASMLFDLLSHAHSNEWQELQRRIQLWSDEATLVSPEQVAIEMRSDENSEVFITFDDPDQIENYFDKDSLADWMLFLHPEQKKLAIRDFQGAARLRGVSGSGKTSVLVHRARYLAKKYHQPILLVTLTESTRKLLDHLADDLCGVERSLILTITMNQLCKQVITEADREFLYEYSLIPSQQRDQLLEEVFGGLQKQGQFEQAHLSHLADRRTQFDFFCDEITYVRGRLRPSEMDLYLNPQAFQRKGRGTAFNESARRVWLRAIQEFQNRMDSNRWYDHEGLTARSLDSLDHPTGRFNTPRCILCDEVQDLSQLEVAILAKLKTPSGEKLSSAENGLFLAGDGAQTIYKKGFTLNNLGIDVRGRSFCLKKNYRNTFEILNAAFKLVARYEFADVDEDNISKPPVPDFPNRHGMRPLILRCPNLNSEAQWVAGEVKTLLDNGARAGQICVVGPNARIRGEIEKFLDQLEIEHETLKEDAYYDSPCVKVSTIESSKGHEFESVFIAGMLEGYLPATGVSESEIPREAARLYVAMTRARDSLTLSYSPTANQNASRFLLAIQPDCDEAVLKNGEIVRD